jgi:hypothetical protein
MLVGLVPNASGLTSIQTFRDRAWDGENNPVDRAKLLAQMKASGAYNNIFLVGMLHSIEATSNRFIGDMHMSLATDVTDTAPGK